MKFSPLLLLFFVLLACKSQHETSTATVPAPVEKVELDPITSTEAVELPPAVLVKKPGEDASSPLRLSELHLSVKVVGNLATTTMEMLFANETDRVLEGELYFPLGQGQTVSRFALDVNGKLREGVIVEKVKGRQAYENTIRQQIDPGLLEWTVGQNFKARIYPIPAKGYKRMIVAYEQEMQPRSNGYQYLLPMHHQETVDSFSVTVQVFQQNVSPQFEENEIDNLVFEAWQENFQATQTYSDYLPNRSLGFLVPQAVKSHKVMIEEYEGEWWFYANLRPEQYVRQKAKPKNIHLIWDASHSGRNRDIAKELSILDRYFSWVENTTIHWHILRNTLESGNNIRVKNGDWSALRNILENLPFDGGSNIGEIDIKPLIADEIILISDGLHTIGEDDFSPQSTPPIYIINTSAVADYSRLEFSAQATGGRFINALGMSSVEAAEALRGQTYQFLGMEVLDGLVEDRWPRQACKVEGAFSLAGKLLSRQAKIRLDFGFKGGNGSQDDLIYTDTLSLDLNQHGSTTGLVPRIWAQKKLAELDLNYKEKADEIMGLAQRFGIVTRNTSLIVLDRVEDYVEYEITPPAELRAAYQSALAEKETQKKVQLFAHLDEVAEAYAIRKAWWQKEFEVPKDLFQSADSTRALDDEDDYDADGVVDMMESEPMLEESVSMADAFGSADEEAPAESKSAESEEEEKSKGGEIVLNKWDPQTPYIKALKAAAKDSIYVVYLRLKEQYISQPSFFLDVGQFFYDQDQASLALRILSNLAELELENHELLRALAYKLQSAGANQEAKMIYEKVLEIRPEEPQSWRDLALLNAQLGENQAAVDGLWEVVKQDWPDRYPEVSVLAAQEMNAIVARSGKKLKTTHIDERLRDPLPTDVRVVLNWDANEVDMDLWVLDPRGEKCYYAHNRTQVGGWLSADFTGGYGPEEFWLRKAIPGTYQVQVNYYGSRQQRIAGPTNIRVEMITNYGRPDEKRQETVMRLGDVQEVITVGEFRY
ncbi:MAG: VIT domain-containing protein [Bacteroidia bacterium]